MRTIQITEEYIKLDQLLKLSRSLALKPQNYIFFKHFRDIQKVSQIRTIYNIILPKWSVFN
jgi:hypothetical protein